MSLHDYRIGRKIADADPPFYALIQAAMRRADTENLGKLSAAWPEVFTELLMRHEAPRGVLPADEAAS